MARKPRIVAPDTIHHVVARGVNRRIIFHDDADCWAWMRMLGEACERHAWRCLAHCMMINHVHLLIQVSDANLSRGIQWLLSEYARRHHQRHGSTGHLFQGRFHSSAVARDPYLLEVVRYILLNPVRAELCTDPERWRWSSARQAFGLDPKPAWMDFSLPYGLLGREDKRSAKRLQQFVRAGFSDAQQPREPNGPGRWQRGQSSV